MGLRIKDIKNSEYNISAVYCIINNVNGKRYVGQTQNLRIRFNGYMNGRFNPHLTHAVKKYGIENFEVVILEKVPVDRLDEREQYWMDFYDVVHSGYNICPIVGTARGIKRSEKTCEKLRKAATGNKRALGHKHSKETCKKISKAAMGHTRFLGRKHTDETRKKMSEVHKGRKVSSETRKKLSKVAIKKSVVQLYKFLNVIIGIFESAAEAARKTGISKSSISECCKKSRNCKSAGGFRWKYLENN